MIAFGFWDYALLVLVSGQATLLAYVRHPKWKALITALPVPFTLAALAVGKPVNTSNIAALNVLLAYALLVWGLHGGLKIPIIPAIAVSAVGYCAAGLGLKSVLPDTEAAFWIACGLTLAIAAAIHRLLPRTTRPDPHKHLPPWLKFPLVAAVIFALILLKSALQGFMTLFPMVGVFAAYEGRRRLDAFCRAFDAFAFAMVPFLGIVRLLQPRLGFGLALSAGWLIYLPILWLQIRDFRPAGPPPSPRTAD